MKKVTGLMMLLTLLFPITGFTYDSKQSSIMGIVRSLGYGAAIHQFKNCLLRSKYSYCSRAHNHFIDAQDAIKAFRKMGPSYDEKMALDKIAKIVRKYKMTLVTIQTMIMNRLPASQIDLIVKIRDKKAIEGLATLWNQHSWSAAEEVEYFLGYGHAIHQFKNYVIRAKDANRVQADHWFAKAEASATQITSVPEDGIAILQVIKSYRAILPRIQEMSAQGKNARDIDKSVKINDKPAFSAFSHLKANN